MKLSIITVNLNNASGLRKTMESVLSQTYTDFEYIVVDGASTDESVDVMCEIGEKIKQKGILIKSISEPDSGIYNAMNKGIRMATGEYVQMLNSADYFLYNDAVKDIIPFLEKEDIIQGNIVVNRKGKYFIHKGYAHSGLSFIEVHHGDFPHQAMFIKKSLHEVNGYYDESYKFIADTLFFLKTLGLGNASFKYVDKTIVYFAPDGVSMQNIKERERERKRMFDENISVRLQKLCTTDERKIAVYEKLRSIRMIWYVTIVLLKICELLGHKKNVFVADKYTEYKNAVE